MGKRNLGKVTSGDLHFGGSRGHKKSAMVPFETTIVTNSYKLSISIVTNTDHKLSNQFTIECLRRSNKINRGW